MAEREQKSQVIVLGKEIISGTKSTSGVYKNPKAEAEIYNKNLKINLEKNITKLILKVLWEYVEATTKKDIPNFLFSLKQNGKEIDRAFWSDTDVFYKFENQNGELVIEIDLEKFYSVEEEIKLDLEAHLECWLEESPWRGGAPQKTAAASGDADVEINLPKIQEPGASPEISLNILPTHSPGKDLKNYINADWGNPYFLSVHLENKSNNILTTGNFTLFENDKNIKDATLKKELESKWKTIIISEDNTTWVLIKDWKWYEDDILGKYKSKETNRKYKYFVTGKTTDEFSFIWKLETDKINVNVRVPDYKIKAMDTYNWVVGAEWLGIGLAAVLFVALALLSKSGAKGTVARGALAGLSGAALKQLANEVKAELNVVMDDPPVYDKNYNKIYVMPPIKVEKINKKIQIKLVKQFLNVKNNIRKSLALSKAMRVTGNRLWSAKIKKSIEFSKMQNSKYANYRRQLVKTFNYLSKEIDNLSLEFLQSTRHLPKYKNLFKAIEIAKLKYLYKKNNRLQRADIQITARYLKSLAKSFYKLSESLKWKQNI